MTHPIPAGPVTCVDCGTPLELSCAGACGTTDASIEAEKKDHPSVAQTSTQKRARTYQPKVCVACGNSFVPTGPNGKKCERCR